MTERLEFTMSDAYEQITGLALTDEQLDEIRPQQEAILHPNGVVVTCEAMDKFYCKLRDHTAKIVDRGQRRNKLGLS